MYVMRSAMLRAEASSPAARRSAQRVAQALVEQHLPRQQLSIAPVSSIACVRSGEVFTALVTRQSP